MKTLSNQCVCCESTQSRLYKIINQYTLNRCNECSLVYLTNPDEEDVNFIAKVENNEVEFWSVPKLFLKYDFIFNKFFKIRLDRLRKYSSCKNIFDIGAGYGFWQKFVTERGFHCNSIEPDLSCYEYANKELNINEIEHKRFEDFSTNKKYSIITMIDVLEHLNEPKNMLSKAHSMLDTEGLIYIQVPNVLGLKIPYGHNLGLPFHLWQFNKKSLYKLLENSNFEPLEYWTGVQGIIGKHENGGPLIYDKFLWGFANIFKCGNRIQVVARKLD